MDDVLLRVENLTTHFVTPRGVVRAVDDVSFDIAAGETFGLVGESGCGKSVTCRSILRLVPSPPARLGGHVMFEGRDLLALRLRDLRTVRGVRIAMVFQDPMTALNPVMRVGDQIAEVLYEHQTIGRRQARARVLELMNLVGIPAPRERIDDYPHQFSGGMRQRVVIAAALACDPRILLADEPTTALDVTIQDQILKLLLRLQRTMGMSVVLVTHDLSIVAQTCHRVAVMYAGKIVEQADTASLLAAPRHPYTSGLLDSLPNVRARTRYLHPIAGAPPDLVEPPSGCRFHPRCPLAVDACKREEPPLIQVEPGHLSACPYHEKMTGPPTTDQTTFNVSEYVGQPGTSDSI